MNKLISSCKILGVLFALCISLNSKAQCNPSFVFVQGANGFVNFTSTSAIANSLTAQYIWSFPTPPFTYSAIGIPGMTTSVTFTTNGVYIVTLTVNQPTACTNTFTSSITVTSVPICTLNPGANFTLGSNGLVNFNNTSTGTVSGTTYTWNFGDGSPLSSSVSPPHTYTANSVYTVTLFASNNSTPACTNSTTFTVNVTSVCNFTAAINYSLIAPGTVSLSAITNSSTNTYTWNFSVPSASTNASNAVVNYTINGIYTVTLAVTNIATGCLAFVTQTINVNNIVPCAITASFTALQGMNGTYYFNNISTGTVSSTSYTWNFGDASSQSSLFSPSHTYTSNGVYTVSLTASNFTPTCFNTKTLVIVVNSICNLNANFTFSLGPNGQVNFNNTSTLPNPTVTVKYNWYIPPIGTFTITNPVVTYSTNGIYTVTLNDTINSLSCSSSITKTLSITNIGACTLTSSFTHTLGTNGFANFTNHSTGTLSGTSYTWDFGDGLNSTNTSPYHTYSNAGTHYVSLIAVNSATCADTSFFALNVTGITCVPNSGFSLTPTATTQYWSILPSYPWNVVNALWSWGDNSTSNTLYASHQYSASGNYNICLSVTVSCGGTSSTCATYSVYKSSGSFVYVNVVKPPGLIEITGLKNSQIEESLFSVYPNPNNGHFTLQYHSNASDITVKVRNVFGQIIYSEICVGSNGIFEKPLDLREEPAGIYFVELNAGGKSCVKKIVISK